MDVIVHSKFPLSNREKSWVTEILGNSENVSVSLLKTFGKRFHHIFNDEEPIEIFLDGPDAEFNWKFQIERF